MKDNGVPPVWDDRLRIMLQTAHDELETERIISDALAERGREGAIDHGKLDHLRRKYHDALEAALWSESEVRIALEQNLSALRERAHRPPLLTNVLMLLLALIILFSALVAVIITRRAMLL